MMQFRPNTMKEERVVSILLLLASISMTVHGASIIQDPSLVDEEQRQIQEQQHQQQQQQQQQRINLIRNHKLTSADISYLVLNQLQHRMMSSLPNVSPKIVERRADSPADKASGEEQRKVQIVVRPILTSKKWLRLCRSRSKSSRFPGCNSDLVRDRQKREEMLRNNLAALLSGLKGSDGGRQRLRMPSLRFG